MASTATVTAAPPDRVERRRARLTARYSQWKLSSLDRVRACGRTVTSNRDGFNVAVSGSVADGTRSAGLGGIQSCGSVWSCPVCSAKIQARRQLEVSTALAVARARRWEVTFLTLTMRHRKGQPLKWLWDQLSDAWAALTTGSGQRAWKEDRMLYGIAGYLRLVEVTHGANGWHVHVHMLMFHDPLRVALNDHSTENGKAVHGAGFTDAELNELATSMFLRWRAALSKKGLRPSVRRGVDIRRVRSDDKIAEYFAKQLYAVKGESSTAHDVSGSHGKIAKHGGRTPFGILADLLDVAATGEVTDDSLRDVELWHEFEQASRGRRQLLWSRGLRDELLASLDDLTDEEVADEAPGGDIYVHADRDALRFITRNRLLAELLEVAESDDTGWNLRGWLDDLGVQWSSSPPSPT